MTVTYGSNSGGNFGAGPMPTRAPTTPSEAFAAATNWAMAFGDSSAAPSPRNAVTPRGSCVTARSTPSRASVPGTGRSRTAPSAGTPPGSEPVTRSPWCASQVRSSTPARSAAAARMPSRRSYSSVSTQSTGWWPRSSSPRSSKKAGSAHARATAHHRRRGHGLSSKRGRCLRRRAALTGPDRSLDSARIRGRGLGATAPMASAPFASKRGHDVASG